MSGSEHSSGEMTMCKCPRCRKLHEIRIDFTGRGVPMIYCPICRGRSSISSPETQHAITLPGRVGAHE